MTEQESVLILLLGEYLFGHSAYVSLQICEADVMRLSVSLNILGVLVDDIFDVGQHQDLTSYVAHTVSLIDSLLIAPNYQSAKRNRV